ncbi:hypothetical protein SAY86_009440 [Trapa natans]|uniref:DNA topoisomerase n=1 Tax=Trapa natans TaxID=22666 RepID=A0AAN7L3X3_TRANT|nr:hypothetical protein SAY86_009440 [Trapa natans]
MNVQLRRGFSSLSMAQGPLLNQFGTHINSLYTGGGELCRACSQLKLDNRRLSCMKIANGLQAQQSLLNFSFSGATSNALSIIAAPRLYYKTVACGSIFRWSNLSVSANSSRCYSHLPKSHICKKDDVFSKEKQRDIGVSGKECNLNTKRKLPKALSARSKKSADDSASKSKDNETIAETQQPTSKQDDKGQGQRELSRSKKNTKKQKSTSISVDADSQVGVSGISSSEAKVEVNLSGDKKEKLSHSSTSSRKASSKKRESSSDKNKAKSAETQGQAVKVTLNSLKTSNLRPLYPPSGKSVVVVESVTKAKVIQRYLGDMYEVLPSYGHVRDLAARSGSVRPDEDFSMVWEVPSPAWTHLKSISVALSRAENLILASDPDREGEAIAWHIIEMLHQQDSLRDNITVARVVFHEITESSIKTALQSPREIDTNLVHAYLARRALDYLIGFNISPLLWRKLPGCQSAGRVQSAALSLICDREMEIDEFKAEEYWSVGVQFSGSLAGHVKTAPFKSNLTHFASNKLNRLSISSHVQVKDVEEKISSSGFKVMGSKSNKMKRNPPTPYITSTLQQDAANKLNFYATHTMKLAQKLYEGVQLSDDNAVGLITYMRTDGLHISDEAVREINSLIVERYGPDFASKTGRKFFKKVKNAQEAHEAIRPTDIRRLPSMLGGALDEDSLKLYTLIWSRAVACQMEPAIFSQIQVEIKSTDESIGFSSSCSKNDFLGYQAVFKDPETVVLKSVEKEETLNGHAETYEVLNSLKAGDHLTLTLVELVQHFTEPPPRYSEGSLVKKLEELGIGRPSTYASTLKVLKDRNYVSLKGRLFHPEFRGRMVSAFLSHHFTEVTDYSFTADMETELDNVSAGLTEWKGLLKDYWTRFSSYCERAATLQIRQVEKMLEKKFANVLFASIPDKSRSCPSCSEGTLTFKVSRYGAGYFIGCDQHPSCKYIAKTLYGEEEEDAAPQNSTTIEEPKLLGLHPVSNEKILLKKGPYGSYVQLGEDRKGYLPKRASTAQLKDAESITLEDAIELLRYPITLGKHPEDGQPVILKIAKVGFTIRHRRNIAPVPKNVVPADITMEKALELLSGKDVRRSGRPKGKGKAVETMEVL